jgi:hypothetical protein
MFVRIEMLLDVGEQDSTQDAVEFAQNEIRNIDSRDLVNIFEYEVQEQ